MKRIIALGILSVIVMMSFSACGNANKTNEQIPEGLEHDGEEEMEYIYTADTRITEVINDPVLRNMAD